MPVAPLGGTAAALTSSATQRAEAVVAVPVRPAPPLPGAVIGSVVTVAGLVVTVGAAVVADVEAVDAGGCPAAGEDPVVGGMTLLEFVDPQAERPTAASATSAVREAERSTVKVRRREHGSFSAGNLAPITGRVDTTDRLFLYCG